MGRLLTLPVSQVLLGPLKEMLESLTLQQEVMREMVAAVGDAERGKQGALNAFLAERHHLRLPREETDRLRQEVCYGQRGGWVGGGQSKAGSCRRWRASEQAVGRDEGRRCCCFYCSFLPPCFLSTLAPFPSFLSSAG